MTKAPLSARAATRAYHHGDLREALVEAALRQVGEAGLDSVSFSSLARQLNVSQAAPYRHFADREALLAEVARRSFTELNAFVRAAVARRRKGSPLSRLAHAYVEFGAHRTDTYRLMYASTYLARAPLGSPLHEAAEDGFLYLLDLLGPRFDKKLRARVAIKFLATLHGIVMFVEQGLLPPRVHKVTVTELIDDLVRDTQTALQAE